MRVDIGFLTLCTKLSKDFSKSLFANNLNVWRKSKKYEEKTIDIPQKFLKEKSIRHDIAEHMLRAPHMGATQGDTVLINVNSFDEDLHLDILVIEAVTRFLNCKIPRKRQKIPSYFFQKLKTRNLVENVIFFLGRGREFYFFQLFV